MLMGTNLPPEEKLALAAGIAAKLESHVLRPAAGPGAQVETEKQKEEGAIDKDGGGEREQ
jgi:hypothetical protein